MSFASYLVKASGNEKTNQIRQYIRNERDPVVMKWKALEESVKLEDYRRQQFVQKRMIEDSIVLPITIRKFIGSLRKSVRSTMRHKGGTPYSIIRNLFMYWDADHSGAFNLPELDACLKSIGVIISVEELHTILYHYDNGKGAHEMSYKELLNDINRGEPTITENVAEGEDNVKMRFQSVEDIYGTIPPIVQQFLEVFRNYLLNKTRQTGGTPEEIIRPIFARHDKQVAGGLTAEQLKSTAIQTLKLTMTDAQAQVIFKYYDRKGRGLLEQSLLIQDICRGIAPILHFHEHTAKEIEDKKRSIKANPFTVQAYQTKPNKVLESFKREVLAALDLKVLTLGGSKKEWLREAFRFWDKEDLGVIGNWKALQGAVKRLGLIISEDDAVCLMKEYDVKRNGLLDYKILIADVIKEDPHFIENAAELKSYSSTTARPPDAIAKCIQKFKSAVEIYTRKSQGLLQPRDVLHGTFARFDTKLSGRVNYEITSKVTNELGLRIKSNDLKALIIWFDTNGTDCLDYNAMTSQMYGEDISTRNLRLPEINTLLIEHRNKVKDQTTPSPLARGVGASAISKMAFGVGSEFERRNRKISGSNNANISMTSPDVMVAHEKGTLRLSTLEKNLDEIQSRVEKDAIKAVRRQQILDEKANIQLKLGSIERQRKILIEEQNLRRSLLAAEEDEKQWLKTVS